jgi:hypothetical protein
MAYFVDSDTTAGTRVYMMSSMRVSEALMYVAWFPVQHVHHSGSKAMQTLYQNHLLHADIWEGAHRVSTL